MNPDVYKLSSIQEKMFCDDILGQRIMNIIGKQAFYEAFSYLFISECQKGAELHYGKGLKTVAFYS